MFLQWTQWIREEALLGQNVVWVNMDETAVPRLVPHRRGYVSAKRSSEAQPADDFERIARRESHSHMTVIGLITQDAGLQRYLPQFFLPKEASTTRAEKALLASMSPPLQWIRGTSGWVNDESLRQVLTCLRATVRRHSPGRPLVLLLDSAAQHLTMPVLRHAANLNIHLVFIPARLTWLLQPLDSHVFAKMKRRLHALQQEARINAVSGTLTTTQWLALVIASVQDCLVDMTWTHAMRGNGATGEWLHLRSRISALIGAVMPLDLTCPSEGALADMVGRKHGPVARLMTSTSRRVASGLVALDMGGEAQPSAPPPLPPPALPPGGFAEGDAAGSVGEGGVAHMPRRRRSLTLTWAADAAAEDAGVAAAWPAEPVAEAAASAHPGSIASRTRARAALAAAGPATSAASGSAGP